MGNTCAPSPNPRSTKELSPPPIPKASATQLASDQPAPTSNEPTQDNMQYPASSSLSQVFAAVPPQPPATGLDLSIPSSASRDSFDSRHVSLSDNSLPQNVRQVLAANKIRRLAQRRKALLAAQAEHQWKIFADLDTKDEAEMLQLAVFMQTLIDTVPGAAAGRNQEKNKLREALSLDENDTHKDDLPNITIQLGEVKYKEVHARHHSLSTNNMKEFDLCDIDLDAECVQEVIDVYRMGGRLSRNSIVKILRKTYRLVLKIGNLTRVNIPDRGMCTVVGDLHGQLSDLLCIIDTVGLPSVDNRFIFNGDFVDRGEKGLEIVCILFLMFVVFGPEVVCMNRGNHEDLPVCRVYGFEQEVKEKYDELLFEMFAEVFNHLPLFSMINESIFVVHGGLFHNPQATIQDLEDIDRTDYFVKPPVPYPQNIIGLSPEDQRKEYLKQLQRDALWSDPTEEYGCYLNPRGAGVSFGPDIASQFMAENGFSMIVRSHECIMRGFELPYQSNNSYSFKSASEDRPGQMLDLDIYDERAGIPFLCTLFSASNYIGGDNDGAILQFASHPFHMSAPVGSKCNMHYYVRRYKTSEADRDLVASNTLSLRELILKKKSALSTAFEAADVYNHGQISRMEWAEIMQRVTLMKIRWLGVINTIAPADCLTPTSVLYRKFLANFSFGNSATLQAMENKGVDAKSVLDEMYGMRKQLETVFYFFDTNGDGVISREEFRDGCARLNSMLHPDCQLTNIDRTLEVMDFDGSGTIDINEFFETFRILDAKDGKVDGVISLAQQNKPKMTGVEKLLS
jgi:serine/threonine-protein phosphatase with EF-hand domain